MRRVEGEDELCLLGSLILNQGRFIQHQREVTQRFKFRSAPLKFIIYDADNVMVQWEIRRTHNFHKLLKLLFLGQVIDKMGVVCDEMLHPVIDLGLLADHQIHPAAITSHHLRAGIGLANPNPCRGRKLHS